MGMAQPPSQRWSRKAENLQKAGVMTVPVLEGPALKKWQDLIWAAMDDFPEYKLQGRHVQRVLGGFGALGNPSSFHHPTVRRMRRNMKEKVGRPLFDAYARLNGWSDVRLELLMDRLCVRCQRFGVVRKDDWHRDIYNGPEYGLNPLPATLPGDRRDELFGGWINLSDRDQKFVCILRSHLGRDAERAQAEGGGFAELTPAQIAEQDIATRLRQQADKTLGSVRTDSKGCVIVPPGHAVIFYQRILHAVHPERPQPTEPQLRHFVGYRLTRDTAPLFAAAQQQMLDNFGVPRVPSGQMPAMFSKNHFARFASTSPENRKFRHWAEQTFQPECLYARPGGYSTPGSRGNLNRSANTNRYMPSLAEMGMGAVFPAYDERDRRVLFPEPLS